MHFARLANTLLKDEESERDSHVFAGNFAQNSPILIFSTLRLTNKPFYSLSMFMIDSSFYLSLHISVPVSVFLPC